MVKGRIRIDGGDWSAWDTDFFSFAFNTTGLFTTLGDYTLELEIWWEGGDNTITEFQVHCVSSRYEFYYDGNGNYLSHWKGGDNALDRPILIVEGFDPANVNNAATYFYAANNFMSGMLDRDCDVFILNFNNGGADMTENAQVVIAAVNYILN